MGCYTQLGIADNLDSPNPPEDANTEGLEIDRSGTAKGWR